MPRRGALALRPQLRADGAVQDLTVPGAVELLRTPNRIGRVVVGALEVDDEPVLHLRRGGGGARRRRWGWGPAKALGMGQSRRGRANGESRGRAPPRRRAPAYQYPLLPRKVSPFPRTSVFLAMPSALIEGQEGRLMVVGPRTCLSVPPCPPPWGSLLMRCCLWFAHASHCVVPIRSGGGFVLGEGEILRNQATNGTSPIHFVDYHGTGARQRPQRARGLAPEGVPLPNPAV